MPARRRSFAPRSVAIAALCVFAATPALGDAVTVRDAAGRDVAITDYQPDRLDRRRGDGDPLCARPRTAGDRGRHHQPLSAARARREAQRRLHAAVVGRGRARPRAVAGARQRGSGTEGDDRRAGGRTRAVRARAGGVHRRRHHRQDPADREGDRHIGARRMPGEAGCRTTSTSWRICGSASTIRAR